jgi:hypothetical protein
MKKRLGFALIFCLTILATMMLTGCGVNEVKELTVIGNAYSEFVVGESYDYKNITVKVVFEDEDQQKPLEIKGDDERISVEGFSTATPGNKTLKLTFSDGKTSATCELPYTVFTNEQTIKSASDIDKIVTQTSADDKGILFFPYSGTYDLKDYKIKRDLNVVARRTAKVTLRDVYIDQQTAKKDLTVSFQNINFTHTVDKGDIIHCVVDNTANSYAVNLTITKCSITANGICTNGIELPTKGDFSITESSFVTPTDEDLFLRLIDFSVYRYDQNSYVAKNTIICNFSYGLMAVTNATIEDNYVDATLTDAGIGDRAADSNSQKNFVYRKNPIFLHAHILPNAERTIDDEKDVFLHVYNNVVNNVQNFIRVYELDNYDYDERVNFDFQGNKVKNAAVLVNTSQLSYASLSKVLADVKAGLTADSTYVKEYKAVIEKDTEIEIAQGMTFTENKQLESMLYYDFVDTTNIAEVVIDNENYIYVGKSKLTDLTSNACYIVKHKRQRILHNPQNKLLT